ncbi:MAG TPA: DEAD/DEAH box helicase [Planctomycetota bacterium]|nr:DEAD/DEAH box helicase [Planctomycetota bacterium]
MSTFADFTLLPTLQASLAEMGLTTPTEIQTRAIPALLQGKSVIGLAETGSGKTLAYVLPVLHLLKMLENEGNTVMDVGKPRALVIVPARELGDQVTRMIKPFTHTTRLRVRSVLGGAKFEAARRAMEGGFEVLVATPGRLLQLMDRELVDLKDVRILVFDEADRMLDQGFLPAAERIAGECPPARQMGLFSATVSPAVEKLMKSHFAGAELIRTEGSHQLVPTLVTVNLNVTTGKRFPFLEDLLTKKIEGGTLIFTNTRDQCDEVAELIRQTGRECLVYRGEMDKVERRANLKSFRDGGVQLLISTDLASRGLDVDHVGRVINYHLPSDPENYLHRVGRTARAGRKGVVINLVTERDAPLMEKLTRIQG